MGYPVTFGLSLISPYAPIGNANQKLWDNFIEKLEKCISRNEPNDIRVILCDTNNYWNNLQTL